MITQLLRTLLIIILAVYLFRFIDRYITPYFVRLFKSDRRQNSSQRGQWNRNPSGGSQRKQESLGEYIDYEEIDDNKN
ncbi:MAG: hypothetical protein Kow00127_24790 [Bacteroidales bacterium]